MPAQYRVLMLSGDNSIATKQQGVFYDMLQEFSKHWTKIDIVCALPPNGQKRHIHKNVTVYPTAAKLAQIPAMLLQTLKLCHGDQYDVIIAHGYGLYHTGWIAFLAKMIFHIPYVLEVFHIDGDPVTVNFREKFLKWWGYLQVQLLSPSATFVRVMNQDMKTKLISKGIPSKKIRLIPAIFIDYSVFKPRKVTKIYDLVWSARLEANKQPLLFLETVTELYKTHPKLKVCLIGQGSLRTAVKKYLIENRLTKIVDFIPFVKTRKDLAVLYNQSSLLVCTSASEGGPRVTLEALACGTPVVSTPVGVMPDILSQGQGGIITKGTVSAMVTSIKKLLDDADLLTQMAQGATKVATNKSAAQVIQNYANQVQSVIPKLMKK